MLVQIIHDFQRSQNTSNTVEPATGWHRINMRTNDQLSPRFCPIASAYTDQTAASINVADQPSRLELTLKPAPPSIKFRAEHQPCIRPVRFSHCRQLIDPRRNTIRLCIGYIIIHHGSILFMPCLNCDNPNCEYHG